MAPLPGLTFTIRHCFCISVYCRVAACGCWEPGILPRCLLAEAPLGRPPRQALLLSPGFSLLGCPLGPASWKGSRPSLRTSRTLLSRWTSCCATACTARVGARSTPRPPGGQCTGGRPGRGPDFSHNSCPGSLESVSYSQQGDLGFIPPDLV